MGEIRVTTRINKDFKDFIIENININCAYINKIKLLRKLLTNDEASSDSCIARIGTS